MFFVHTLEVNDNHRCLVTNIVQNILFESSTEESMTYRFGKT